MSRSPTYGYLPSRLTNNEVTPSLFSGSVGPRSLSRLAIILGIGGFSLAFYFGTKYILNRRNQGTISSSTESMHRIQVLDSSEKPKVILHQCPRGYRVPCISPFPLKLETFLRLAGIPYQVELASSSDGQSRDPWLTLGDESIFNTHECVPLLSKTFNINLEEGAKASRLTASRLVGVMLENHIYWGIALWRWVQDQGTSLPSVQPFSPPIDSPAIAEITEAVRHAAFYAGLGRLSFDMVVEVLAKDFSDLSAALGKHPFFLGEKPGEVDCTAFAMLSQIVWSMPNSPFEMELRQYDNLCEFILRMREKYWSDWNEILSKPGEDVTMEKNSVFYPVTEFHIENTTDSEDEHDLDLDDMSEENHVSVQSTPTSLSQRQSIVSTGRNTPIKPRSKNRKTNVHFVQKTPQAQAVDSTLTEERKNVLEEEIRQFDDLNKLQNVQALLNHLNKELEKRTTSISIAQPTGTASNQNRVFKEGTPVLNFNKAEDVQMIVDTLKQSLGNEEEKPKVPEASLAFQGQGPNKGLQQNHRFPPQQYVQPSPTNPQAYFPQQQPNAQHFQATSRPHSRPALYYMGPSSRPDLGTVGMQGGLPVQFAPVFSSPGVYYTDQGLQPGMLPLHQATHMQQQFQHQSQQPYYPRARM